jgi:putative transposase
MSRKGDCWDNVPAESFFKTLKTEMVYHREFKGKQEAKLAIFEFIEVWYNRKRRHSSLEYLSPKAFEEKLLNEQKAA